MSWFPFQYRDEAGWHADGLPITTTSNESAKLLDAAMTQLIFNENDPGINVKISYVFFAHGN